MYAALVIEIIMIVLIVYVPGLNRLFMLRYLKPKVNKIYIKIKNIFMIILKYIKSQWASTALWMMGFIFIIEEVRKFIIRKRPNGWLAKLTLF